MKQNRETRNKPKHLRSVATEEPRIYNKKRTVFSTTCRVNRTAICKTKLDHSLTPYTNSNSKQIQDLSGRPEARKISLEKDKQSAL